VTRTKPSSHAAALLLSAAALVASAQRALAASPITPCDATGARLEGADVVTGVHGPFVSARSGDGWHAAGGAPAKLPLGMPLEVFQGVIDVMRANPEFHTAEAIVLYGSRANHEYGYAPETTPAHTSDLDVRVLYGAGVDVTRRLDLWERINTLLEPVSDRAGFKVGEEIPAIEPFASALTEGVFTRRTAAEEARLWQETLAEGEGQGWTRSQYKQRYLARVGAGFLKGVLIVVPRSPAAETTVKALRDLGYHNVVVTD
jgi:hypothetical protein